MKSLLYGCGISLLAVGSTPLLAQEAPVATLVPAPAPAPLAPIAPPTGNAVLRTGTQVPFRLLHEVTTEGKNLHVGDRVRMEVAEPVLVQGVAVVPAGTPAVGEITEVRNKGMWGKSGKFTARMLYLTVNGRQIRLSGGFDDKGVSGGVGAAAVSAIVFLPAGFFMTGTSARLPAGVIVQGFVDEDVPLAIQTQVAAPMAVTAPAPETPVAGEAALTGESVPSTDTPSDSAVQGGSTTAAH
jgi:hypothetical protein